MEQEKHNVSMARLCRELNSAASLLNRGDVIIQVSLFDSLLSIHHRDSNATAVAFQSLAVTIVSSSIDVSEERARGMFACTFRHDALTV